MSHPVRSCGAGQIARTSSACGPLAPRTAGPGLLRPPVFESQALESAAEGQRAANDVRRRLEHAAQEASVFMQAGSPPITAPSPPSSATWACRFAPPGSPRFVSSSCRSPPPSSPAPSASTTPPLCPRSRPAPGGIKKKMTRRSRIERRTQSFPRARARPPRATLTLPDRLNAGQRRRARTPRSRRSSVYATGPSASRELSRGGPLNARSAKNLAGPGYIQ